MIYSVTGKLILNESGFSVVESNGIGYRIYTSISSQKTCKLNTVVTFYTYLNVREDAMELFGFTTKDELNSFKLLISISGVGPKVAIAILSSLSSEQIALAVANGDYKTLTIAPGVGPKLAQRIVLELKDKVKGLLNQVSTASNGSVIKADSKVSQAFQALAVLGYNASEVSPILQKLDSNLSVSEMIKETLKAMKKG